MQDLKHYFFILHLSFQNLNLLKKWLGHPSLEIEITLQCEDCKNRTNSMNLWQKPMSSYKKKFSLGVWPFLQIRAERIGRVKNVSDPKSDGTLLNQLLKTRNFAIRPNMHFQSRIILIMGNVFLKCLDLPSKIATLPKWMFFG